MSIRASNKRWIAALSAALMVCVCASASAQNYSLGDEADEVATIQTALKQLKLYSAGITGHYGEKTEAAVKKFQKKYAFEDNGIVDEDTRAALYEAAGITYTASGSSSSSSSSASSSSSSSVSGSAILRYGTRSELIGIYVSMGIKDHSRKSPFAVDALLRYGLFVIIKYLEYDIIQRVGIDIVLTVVAADRHCSGDGIRFHLGNTADIVRHKKRKLRRGNIGNGVVFRDTVERERTGYILTRHRLYLGEKGAYKIVLMPEAQ